MKGAKLFWVLSCIFGIQSLSASPRIMCGKEREGDEWHPRLTYKLEELDQFKISNTSIALPYVSTVSRMAACVTPDPCLNGGTRIVEDGVYRCVCFGNHVGQYCQSCRVAITRHRVGQIYYDYLGLLHGKSRISFRVRGDLSEFGIRLKDGGRIFVALCHGFSRYTRIQIAVIDSQRRGWSQISTSGHLRVHCGPSGYDSYWIENTKSHFLLGLSGNSTPVMKKDLDGKAIMESIGLKGACDTEWKVDHPCYESK